MCLCLLDSRFVNEVSGCCSHTAVGHTPVRVPCFTAAMIAPLQLYCNGGQRHPRAQPFPVSLGQCANIAYGLCQERALSRWMSPCGWAFSGAKRCTKDEFMQFYTGECCYLELADCLPRCLPRYLHSHLHKTRSTSCMHASEGPLKSVYGISISLVCLFVRCMPVEASVHCVLLVLLRDPKLMVVLCCCALRTTLAEPAFLQVKWVTAAARLCPGSNRRRQSLPNRAS